MDEALGTLVCCIFILLVIPLIILFIVGLLIGAALIVIGGLVTFAGSYFIRFSLAVIAFKICYLSIFFVDRYFLDGSISSD